MLKRCIAILGISLIILAGCAPQQQTAGSKGTEITENVPAQTGSDRNIELKKVERLLEGTPDAIETEPTSASPTQEGRELSEPIRLADYVPDSPVQGSLFQTTVVPENPSFSDDTTTVGLNFDDADIYDVTKVVSEITKKSFIIDKDVTGTVTIFSESPMTPDQVFELYRTVLELNGLAIVQVGDFYKIEKKEKARQRYLVEDSGTVINTEDRLVTRVVKLKHIQGDAVKNALARLVPEGKEIVVYPDEDGDTLIITDLMSNVKKILAVIEQIDISRYADQFLEIIPVQHADLLDLIDDLTKILAIRSDIPLVEEPGAPLATLPGEAPTAQPPSMPQSPSGQIVPPGTRTRIYPVSRINSLVVSTNQPEVVALVRKWVAILDHPSRDEENISGQRQTYVYPVQYSTAEELTPVLVDVYAEAGQPELRIPADDDEGEPELPVMDEPVRLRDGSDSAPIFIPDTNNNSIIIKATPRQFADIQSLLEKLDRRPLQVLIDVIIAEVQLGDSDIFGVQGMLMGQGQLTAGRETNSVETTSETIFQNVIPIDSEGFRFVAAAPGRFLMQLRALATQNKVKVLSRPHIMVRHNEPAKINVGDEVPITETSGSGDNARETVRYRNTGIILEVTPRLNSRGDVVMEISQEVSDVGQKSFGDTGAASFTTRNTKTSVVTRDNYPLVMGGLMSSQNRTNHQGVPVLKEIPLLGRLFRFNEQESSRVELLIIVTPRVVKDPDEGWTLTENILAERIKRLEEFFSREETDADKLKRFFE